MRKHFSGTLGILLMLILGLSLFAGVPAHAVEEIDWATSSVGSSGHAALTSLTTVLNREMDDYNFNVLPTAGAVQSMIQYGMHEADAFYGADVGFLEYAEDRRRLEGFAEETERELVQTFWGFTLEVGLAIRAEDVDKYEEWRDLEGETVFTGPAPWDVRAALLHPMEVLDVGHEYTEIDLDMVGSSLGAGHIEAFNAYTSGERTVPPWVMEAEMETDIATLNPSEEEIEILEEEGIEVVSVDPDVFETDPMVDEVYNVPFFYGFHTGPEVMPEEDVVEMLEVIKENSEELEESDATFGQINEDIIDIQVRGIRSTHEDIKVHPGLATFLQEHDAWEEEWDDRIME